MALALAATQIEAQATAAAGGTRAEVRGRDAGAATLGWVYLTDHYAAHAEALLAELRRRWPGVAWVGAVGVGIAANGVEYVDEPALALMLAALPRDRFRLFSGVAPLAPSGFSAAMPVPAAGSASAGTAFAAAVAQVHADPATPDAAGLIAELAERTTTGYLFGGMASSRTAALHIADGVFAGGLSGVAFDGSVALLSRVTQGCQPIGPLRRVSAAERNVVLALDGKPALDCLLRDLGVDGREPRDALPRIRQTLAGLSQPGDAADDGAVARPGRFGTETRVRHLVGLDPARRGIAIADDAPLGTRLTFCSRDAEAARRDLTRICTELREELEPEALALETALAVQGSDAERAPHPARRIAGAVYVSCTGRGGPHFGAPSAELAIVRHALGDVPLVGFFASGEIARHHLYGYTGVLTLFTA